MSSTFFWVRNFPPTFPARDAGMEQSDNTPPIISERLIVDGTETPVALLADGRLRWSNGVRRCLHVDKEVLGFVTDGVSIKIKTILEAVDGCCHGSRKLVRKDIVFQPLSEESQRLWSQKLREYLDSLGRPKRLFIFLNPFGGKKTAPMVFNDHVKPLLEDAEIQITVQETKHQFHAKEVAHALDIPKYDGIICVSGDGILVEVINGLLERDDWETAVKIPIGVVPAGTGNGVAKSLLDSVGDPCTAVNAALAIIRGLVADVDIESEKYRWMGSARFDFYALNRIFHLRQYNGRISFVPAPGFETHGEPASYPAKSTSIDCKSTSTELEPIKLQSLRYRGPDINLENLSWRVINGPFISLWMHNVPWGTENLMAAPEAQFSDGYADLIIIKDCPRLPLLSVMSEMSNGRHVKSPYVIYLKVKALFLEPGSRVEEQEKGGIIDVDGEVLARGKGTYQCDRETLMTYDQLQVIVDQGLATLFAPV
ncbi:sphingosine kinase 1-like isoform X2 [Prosopis cineraria]|uniref:sphingosine kinase 1-like isoform X2 n=1 Tax=Prosopis cineraria TaxID=364024 RepID=UPI00240EEC81|nr:sphingosine kinase 1-like isoform X2 [Prosopis cineraria]